MAQTGEINNEFGIYRNSCCGAEIVVPVGLLFPECPRCCGLNTEWTKVAHSTYIPHAKQGNAHR
jgi:hypothetical protein